MPRRMILTDAERQNFLALPTDDDILIRHWSLDDATIVSWKPPSSRPLP